MRVGLPGADPLARLGTPPLGISDRLIRRTTDLADPIRSLILARLIFRRRPLPLSFACQFPGTLRGTGFLLGTRTLRGKGIAAVGARPVLSEPVPCCALSHPYPRVLLGARLRASPFPVSNAFSDEHGATDDASPVLSEPHESDGTPTPFSGSPGIA